MLAAISEKTGWSTSLLITIATGAVLISIAFANVSDRVVTLEAKQQKAGEQAEKFAEKVTEQQTELKLQSQRSENNYAHILEALGEMKGDLRALKARK